MSPWGIPKCDVLELDCKGVEISIIKNITSNPKVLIVELHPCNFDEEYEKVLDILQKKYEAKNCYGYESNRVENKSPKNVYNF